MQAASLEKLVSKIDEQKVNELAKLLDLTPALNEVLEKVRELKETGALDTLVNTAYITKTLKDMLNDDSLENLGRITSSILEFGKVISNEVVFKNLTITLENAQVLADLTEKLKVMRDNGTLDTLFNMAYTVKTLKDMLNDEALQSLAGVISSSLELLKSISEHSEGIKILIDKSHTLSDLIVKLESLKQDRTLDVVFNSLYTIRTLRDMLNDEAIQTLGKYVSNLLEILKEMDEKTVHSIKSTIKRLNTVNNILVKLEELEATGALDAALNMAYAAKTLKDMLNDEALARISSYLSTFLEVYPKAMDFFEKTLSDVPYRIVKSITSEQVRKSLESPPQIGLGGLIRMFSDPDVQRGMGVIYVILKAIGSEFKPAKV